MKEIAYGCLNLETGKINYRSLFSNEDDVRSQWMLGEESDKFKVVKVEVEITIIDPKEVGE